jgi:C1A family cysteine protease
MNKVLNTKDSNSDIFLIDESLQGEDVLALGDELLLDYSPQLALVQEQLQNFTLDSNFAVPIELDVGEEANTESQKASAVQNFSGQNVSNEKAIANVLVEELEEGIGVQINSIEEADLVATTTNDDNSLLAYSSVLPTEVGTNNLPTAPGTEVYTVDDGSSENSIGLINGGDIMWLNQFTALPGSETISSIALTWGTPLYPGDIPSGKPTTVALYEDPDDDGNPDDAVLLATASTSVTNPDSDLFTTVSITPSTVSGSFFVGALLPNQQAGEYPASLDQSAPVSGRSWIVSSTTLGTFNLNDLSDPNHDVPLGLVESYGFPGNWLLRADAELPQLGSISGMKWNDLDGDGDKDAGEPGLANWEIYIDINQNGQLDTGEPVEVTDAQGNYTFSDLSAGTYVIAEVQQEGWEQTYPSQNLSSLSLNVESDDFPLVDDSSSFELEFNPETHHELFTVSPLQVSSIEPSSSSLQLPTSFDLRSGGYVTSVKDQGSCGSCWTFATYAALESSILLDSGSLEDFSENHLKNYHGFDWGPCDGGNAQISEAYLSRWSGPVDEADDPYNDWDDRPSPGGDPQYYVCEMNRYDTDEEIKNELMDVGALYTSMYWNNSFFNSFNNTYYYPGTNYGNHAVTIVGWDDNKVTDAPNPGAWLIKNSWGTSFGDNGYFWIAYDDMRGANSAESYHEAVEAETFSRVYDHDEFGNVNSLNNPHAFNAFTPEADESLQSVGFYTLADNATYDIKIYDDFTGGSLSNLLGSTTGTTRYGGYHTIDLPSSIPLTAGDSFYVYLNLTNGGNYPQAVEHEWYGYTSNCTANPGESFYSFDNINWTDLTTYDNTANFCIKALTTTEPIPGTHTVTLAEGQDLTDIDFGNKQINPPTPIITVTVSPASVNEDGTDNLIYTFTRTDATTNPLTVNFTTGGTATQPGLTDSDYTVSGGTLSGNNGSITFEAGSSTATLTVNPTDDSTFEPDETVIVNLASGTGYDIGTPSAATGTILNDDPQTSNQFQPDFNLDGKRDFVWRNEATGRNVVWYMDGATLIDTDELLSVNDPNWQIVGAGDPNGDQNTDIYWRNEATGRNVVWYMNGATRIDYDELSSVNDPNWQVVGIGDADGDSLVDDIYWRNQATGRDVVWFMEGASRTDYDDILQVSNTDWQIVSVGDLDGDSLVDDLLWRNQVTGRNVEWFMECENCSSTAELLEVTNMDWQIVGTGDATGDQKTDIFWRNQVDGRNVCWAMDGTNITSVDEFPQVTNTDWQIVI